MNPASTNTPDPRPQTQDPPSAFIQPQNWFTFLDWGDWFAAGQPIEVDLGAGDGGFIAARAKAFPEVNFLAVERLLGRARKIDKKARRLGLANLRVLRMESFYTIRWLIPAASVRAFYLLFPDPWPKKRHHKNRIIRGDFLEAVERALLPGGNFFAATDHAEYFAEILEAFGTRPGWKTSLVKDSEWFAEKTDFEIHFLREQKEIGRMKAEWSGGV
jgi:tRNA (guanine-N7-)-methyltransferase